MNYNISGTGEYCMIRYSAPENVDEAIHSMLSQILFCRLGADLDCKKHPTIPYAICYRGSKIKEARLQAEADYHFEEILKEFLALWERYVHKNRLEIAHRMQIIELPRTLAS